MEQDLIEQYLARIGYTSRQEQQIPEPDPDPRPDIRPVTTEDDQAMTQNHSHEQFTAQQRDPATISSRSAFQNHRLELRRKKSPPSALPSTFSTSWQGTEASYHDALEPSHEHMPPSLNQPPGPPTKAEIIAGHHSELECRQKICLKIERQISACQKEIRTHASKQKKINIEHEKRIAELMPDENRKPSSTSTAEEQNGPTKTTAEEAEMEEMRNIYQQYDRGSIGVPNAELVDGFFAIVANTEHHLKKAEEANSAARAQEVKLEGKLYGARCVVYEMEEEVRNGLRGREDRQPKVEDSSRVEGHKEGRRKSRRWRGAEDNTQQGKLNGGGEGGGRRRRNVSSEIGKMNSYTAVDS